MNALWFYIGAGVVPLIASAIRERTRPVSIGQQAYDTYAASGSFLRHKKERKIAQRNRQRKEDKR